MAIKIGKFADPHVAFWHIASFLATHPDYHRVQLGAVRRVQHAISLGTYCCMVADEKTVHAVATWQGINIEAMLRTRPHYTADNPEPLDGVFLTSLAALDRASLKTLTQHLRTTLSNEDVYWDRHNGKLGHRSKTLR